MAGVKGCWVCGRTHQAATEHTKNEIISPINKIRARQPSAAITVDDLAMITSEFTESGEEGDNKPEDSSDNIVYSDDETHIGMYIIHDELETHKSDEQYLADVSLLHGRTYACDIKKELAAMHAELRTGEEPVFKGLHLDTFANRSSVMSIAQYKAYCEEFRVPSGIDKWKQCTLLGIGGSSSTIGTATIPVPFKDLQLTIDVDFKIVCDTVPTLLSNRYMIVNGLDISLQDKVVKLGNKTQPLILENYFFIHKWDPSDVSHSMYTDADLRQ